MHILMISNMYPNKYNPNLGIFVEKQVEALIDLGVKVTVLAPVPIVLPLFKYFSSKWRNYSILPKEEIRNNIRVIHTRYFAIPGGILKQYWFYSNYLLFIHKIIELTRKSRFDIIHVQGSAPDDYAGYLLSKKLKIPYIQTLHGEALLDLALKGRRFSKSKIAIEKANTVIAVSSKIEKKIYELTNRKYNVVKVLNGYTASNIDEIINSNSNDDCFYILFAGNLIPQKGCDFLIEAFSKLQSKYSNLTLQIAGTGTDDNNLKKKAKQMGINDKVMFYGYLKHKRLMLLMSQCDIFIMPSWNEAFGIVYLEAMSFKKPVIGTLGEGIDDFIKDGVNGLLVKSKSVDSIVEKLTLLIENKELRETIAKNGYQSAKQLTWRYNAEQVLRVYEKVLNINWVQS